MSRHNYYDHSTSGPNLASSPTSNEQPMPYSNQAVNSNFYHDHHHRHPVQNPSPSIGLSALEPVHIDHLLSHDPNINVDHDVPGETKLMVDQATKCDDDYGFLFDLDGSINGMGFDGDDGSSIFL